LSKTLSIRIYLGNLNPKMQGLTLAMEA